MFTFAGHALASGQATGQFPGMGGARLSGGSPRYQIYPTRDGKFVCCAALEQKFWEAFTAAIGLDAKFVDDRRDPAATKAAVAAIVAGRTADEWRPVLAAADCCVTVMATLEEALARSAFHRARAVRAQGDRTVRRSDDRTAGADRSAVPRRSGRRQGCTPARRYRLRQGRSDAGFHYSASPRIRRGCDIAGATPSRMAARRSGPTRSSR